MRRSVSLSDSPPLSAHQPGPHRPVLGAKATVTASNPRLLSLHGDVGPVEAGPGKEHVSNQRLDGGLAYQAHKEELLDDRGGDDAQRGEAEKEAPKSAGLVGVLVPDVLFQGTLGLLLDVLHMAQVRQPHSICKGEKERRFAREIN